jgi:predicted 2-oxoglutarate/Fe(II)-dependent dioxygenase YbiX
MALKGTFQLPWTPVAGDFAPEWSAKAEGGRVFASDSTPLRPQLLCFLSAGETESAGALLEQLAAHTWEIDALGCALRVFMPSIRSIATLLPFPLLFDENAVIARAFCLPLEQRATGTPLSRGVLVSTDGHVIASMELPVSPMGAEAVLHLVRSHAPFTASRSMQPPILHLPQLFSSEICRMLIDAFHSGNTYAGKMLRMQEGVARRIVDSERKQRRDFRVERPMRDWIWQQLLWRMAPAVRKAFHFDITRFEYLQVGRYTAEESGHFVAHRDDGNAANAHRRFAITANLNDDYDGGELSFPEYGASYRPAAGDAVLFSCSLLHEAMKVTRGERFILVGMFWGDGQVTQYERSLALRSETAKPTPAPPAVRRRQIIESARVLREIAGDISAFGPFLDGRRAAAKGIPDRVDLLRREVIRLRDDLKGLRKTYLDRQLQRLQLGEKPSDLRLHIGCGGHRLPGWVNIDVNGGDLRMDLRWPLPFPDDSVKYVFASHVIEHVYRQSELPMLLKEIRRVLQPGGVVRIIVPDIAKCIRAYSGNDSKFFSERSKTWKWAAECKTPLDHFLGYAGANQTLENFGGHKYGYDFPTLTLALQEAGFSAVTRSDYMRSVHEDLRIDEHSHNATANVNGEYYSLFVEATK